MSPADFLTLVVGALNELEIPYMITGSVCSSFYGNPRSTHDLAIVVELDSDAAARIHHHFSAAGFYVSEVAIREALAHQSMFNVLSNHDGDKAED